MTQINRTANPPVYSNTINGILLEVYKDEGLSFIGYANGERSIAASREDVAVRALVKKHVNGLPAGTLVNLNEYKAKRQGIQGA